MAAPSLSLQESSDVSSEEFSDPLMLMDSQDGGSDDDGGGKVTEIGSAICNAEAEQTGMSSAASTMLHKWLRFYVRFCGSAANQDKLLKLIQWSSWMISFHCFSKQSKWLEKLSLEISMARYVTRLLGFPIAAEAAAHDSWTLKEDDEDDDIAATALGSSSFQPYYSFIGKLLSWSMVAYFSTEHYAYLLWMKPNDPLAGKRANRWSYISCRFWLAYIGAELAQCLLQEYKWSFAERRSTVVGSAKQANLRLQTIRNALFVLPCLHWSLPQWDTRPWLRTSTVNGLMWMESVVSLYQAVRNQV